jgi:hypothetical protein
MSRKLYIAAFLITTITLFFASLPASVLGEELTPPRPYAIGYQFSRPASGFTVKIPITEQYFIQPVFAYTLVEKTDLTRKNMAVGVRAISNLPARQEFRPYTGISWGHSEGFYDDSETSPSTTGGSGFDLFIGVEYEKYMFHPTLEIGLGSYARTDGTYIVGTTFSFSLLYYF